MTRRLSYSILFASLPFLIEGVRGGGLDARGFQDGLAARQFFTPTPAPSFAPMVILTNPGTLTACTPASIRWLFAGAPDPLSLTATNLGVSQDAPPPALSTRPAPTFTDGGGDVFAVPSGAAHPVISSAIASGIDPRPSSITWNVALPSGWYRIIATINSQVQTQTTPFFVRLGTDTSCLDNAPAPTPSSTSTSMTSSSSPILGQVTTSAALPSSTITSLPSSSSSESNTGAIAGAVVGAIALIIIILLVVLCLRRRKNHLDKPIGGQTGGAKLVRGWGGLGSIDSNYKGRPTASPRGFAATATARHTRHSSASASFGRTFPEENRGVNSAFSPSEEKFSGSPASRNPFDDPEDGMVLAALPSNGRSPSSVSSFIQSAPQDRVEQGSSSTINTFSYPQGAGGSPPGETFGGAMRRGSADSTGYPPAQPSPTHRNHHSMSLAASDIGWSYSAASSLIGAPMSSNTSLQLQNKNVNRQSIGTQSIGSARKTPRKPVPTYDPSIVAPSVAASSSTPPSSYPITGASPSPVTPITNPVPSGSSLGHYPKKALGLAGNDGDSGGGGGLAHKSSFGPGGVEGKPVHYLIPDMPLPQE